MFDLSELLVMLFKFGSNLLGGLFSQVFKVCMMIIRSKYNVLFFYLGPRFVLPIFPSGGSRYNKFGHGSSIMFSVADHSL